MFFVFTVGRFLFSHIKPKNQEDSFKEINTNQKNQRKKVDRNKDKTNKNEKNSKNHNFMDINPLLRGSLQNIHISEDSLKLGIIVWITVNGKMKRVDTFTVQLLERCHNYLASKI